MIRGNLLYIYISLCTNGCTYRHESWNVFFLNFITGSFLIWIGIYLLYNLSWKSLLFGHILDGWIWSIGFPSGPLDQKKVTWNWGPFLWCFPVVKGRWLDVWSRRFRIQKRIFSSWRSLPICMRLSDAALCTPEDLVLHDLASVNLW